MIALLSSVEVLFMAARDIASLERFLTLSRKWSLFVS